MLRGRARANLEQWESVNGPVEDWQGDESGSTRGEVLFDEPF